MALIMEIMKTIAGPVQELVFWLNETYQVDTQETFNKWRELTGMNIQVVDGDASDECEPIQVVKKTKIPKVKNACCQHLFASGSRAGEQCSTKPKNGADYCSAHRAKPKKNASDGEEEIKKPKQPKKKKVDDIYASDGEEEIKKPKQPKKKKDDVSASDGEEEIKKPKFKPLKKTDKKPKKESAKKKKIFDSADEADGSEPESRVKPLLKKRIDEDDQDIVDNDLDFD
jgi:hypothetical protein